VDPPTAIVSVNSQTTIGVLRALRRAGIRQPDDISLVSFDDLPTGEFLDPPLTAVVQPSYQLGVRAAELLLERRAQTDRAQTEVTLAATLEIRGSTGPPREQLPSSLADPV
jgi:DNA-binding LacI/PurR family transcriptional regulator